MFAASDLIAIGAMRAFAEHGLRIPDDIALAGFDDIPDAAYTGLTTVRQPIREKGRLAGLLAMDPDYHQRQITLPIDLVVRSSTGPVTPSA